MKHTPVFTEISNQVEVRVRPLYLEEQSDAIQGKHVFVYFITIRNHGNEPVTLLKRHWNIKDSNGETYEVDGDGVVGKKPTIVPGEEYEYNSSCVLKSYIGEMRGYYLMEKESGASIKVTIPRFVLRSHILN
ncbi:MAG: Co2+/Mg2+ efflux protein ApaG [Balneolaceae bacterium]|nr:Co2+/Mg2+ efflux protein ApaG [Balneolaceae bacterium]